MNLDSLLTESAGQLAGAVVIATLAFLLGTFRRAILQRLRTRHTRKYWSPFRGRGIVIVLGSFPSSAVLSFERHRPIDTSALQDFEPYGLVGFGEVLALLALQDHLRTLGLEDVSVVAQSTDLRTIRPKHLVLVGGPDSNNITQLAMQSSQLPVRFADNPNSKTDMHVAVSQADGSQTEEQVFTPTFFADNSRQLSRDYGFVAQVRSPLSEDCTAILLVGVYGAGVVAAAQLVTSSYGVSRMRRINMGRCIAVFRVDVGRNNEISTPRIERCEALGEVA